MGHDHCQLSEDPAKVEALIEDCVAQLRARGLRRSRGLDALLWHMARHHRPTTLAELATVRGLRTFDQATVYRLVIKLEQAGLVRRLGLHERATYFQLLVPGHHHDYLVCTDCGKIEDVNMHCPAEALENRIMARTGYQKLYHELEFFGVCPDCTGG